MKLNKKFFLFLFVQAFLLSGLFAQTPDELMNNANNMYQQNNFAEAQKIYKELLNKGYESPVLLYNLGNAHYRLGDLGYAIYYYEKALKLAPSDEDIIQNIKIANAHTIDKINEVPKIFITRWWNSIVVSLSVSGWSFVLLLVFILFLFYLGLYLLSRKNNMQRIAFFSGSAVLFVMILVFSIWMTRLSIETSENYGILCAKNATVKVSPDFQSNDAFMIHEGIKFSLEEKINSWYKIKLADGKLGWLHQDVVGKI